MGIEITDIVYAAWAVPLGLLWREIKELRTMNEHLRASRPSRDEMEKYVQLAQRPAEQLLIRLEMKLDRMESKLDANRTDQKGA